MSRAETLGYALTLRAAQYEHLRQYDPALADYREALKNYRGPSALNNLAWLIVTKDVSGRRALAGEALRLARQAVELSDSANRRDTLACALAFSGDFAEAEREEEQAFNASGNAEFRARLEQFRARRDCSGAE